MGINVVVCSNDFKFKLELISELKKTPELNVNGNAFDVMQAARFLVKNSPNVVIIDVSNQNVTDLFLKDMLDKSRAKIIILRDAEPISFPKSGVTDFVYKPPPGNKVIMGSIVKDLVYRIKSYAGNTAPTGNTPSPAPAKTAFPQVSGSAADFIGAVDIRQKIVVIASSTGGTEALAVLFKDLPANSPPIVVVQHMPPLFTKQFADRLDRLSQMTVREAENGNYLKKGTAFIAPGDLHLRLVNKSQKLAVECFMGEKIHGVRPAADVLFSSSANITGRNTIAVILTGMGVDGAKGMFELHAKGAKTIGQDQATSVVYGMPKAAYEMGALDFQLPITSIAKKLVELY